MISIYYRVLSLSRSKKSENQGYSMVTDPLWRIAETICTTPKVFLFHRRRLVCPLHSTPYCPGRDRRSPWKSSSRDFYPILCSLLFGFNLSRRRLLLLLSSFSGENLSRNTSEIAIQRRWEWVVIRCRYIREWQKGQPKPVQLFPSALWLNWAKLNKIAITDMFFDVSWEDGQFFEIRND